MLHPGWYPIFVGARKRSLPEILLGWYEVWESLDEFLQISSKVVGIGINSPAHGQEHREAEAFVRIPCSTDMIVLESDAIVMATVEKLATLHEMTQELLRYLCRGFDI